MYIIHEVFYSSLCSVQLLSKRLFISSSKTRVCVNYSYNEATYAQDTESEPGQTIQLEERSVRSRWGREMCQITSKVSFRQDE